MLEGKYVMTTAEAKLVRALRHGHYKQAAHRLHNNGFCCLGVACDVSKLGHWDIDPNGKTRYTIDDNDDATAVLPDAVRAQLGWEYEDGLLNFKLREGDSSNLTTLNDSGEFTFDMIADLIEAGCVR